MITSFCVSPTERCLWNAKVRDLVNTLVNCISSLGLDVTYILMLLLKCLCFQLISDANSGVLTCMNCIDDSWINDRWMNGWTDRWVEELLWSKEVKDWLRSMFQNCTPLTFIIFGALTPGNKHKSAKQHSKVLVAQNWAHKNIDWLKMFHNKATA